MKTVLPLLLLSLVLNGTSFMDDQKKDLVKEVIEVDGVCSMCKTRIEKSAFTAKGVKSAQWDVDSHQLTVVYDRAKVSMTQIEKEIAEVGHNTSNIEAPKAAYDALPMCCKYLSIEKH